MSESFMDTVRSVSENFIRPVSVEIGRSDDFPWGIWKNLGEAGILGLGVPEEFGGLGSGAPQISAALHELVFSGCNLGICLSVLIHNIVAKYVLSEHAKRDIKEKLLPMMANGTSTCSFAVSEPGRGGHPKFIETRASRIDESSGKAGFTISGEKSYLTNGPIADYFIVIAVSGEESGRKMFTAFLMGTDAPGFEKTPQMKIPFFRPSPHGGIKFTDCKAAESDIVGTEGRAYDEIVMPFRDIENSIMAGPVSGAMKRLLKEAVKTASSIKQRIKPEASAILGRMNAVVELAFVTANKMAYALDNGEKKEIQQILYFQFREICNVFNNLLELWDKAISSEVIDPQENTIYEILKNDLIKSTGLGEYILKANLTKSGNNLISGFTY